MPPHQLPRCRSCAMLLMALTVLLNWQVAYAADAPVRLALVSTSPVNTAGGVVLLAEAKLAGREGLELLDRQKIETVLKEQKLALSGLMEAAQTIRIGQLLAVNLFCVVEQSPDARETLGAVVYEAKSGLRLWDATLTSQGIPDAVQQVVAGIEQAILKRQALQKGLRTISLVSVRNADLPRNVDATCDSLGLLLERELSRSPEFAILERKRLAWLLREQQLATTDVENQQLLSATVQLDLQFARDGDGIQATAILSDATGLRIQKTLVKSPRLDSQLLTPLANAVLRDLNARPLAGAVDRDRESQRYFREAQIQASFQNFPNAIQALESAVLLSPEEVDYQFELADYLLHQANVEGRRACRFFALPGGKRRGEFQLEPLRGAVARAKRAVELYSGVFETCLARNHPELKKYRFKGSQIEGSLNSLRQYLPNRDDLTDADRAEWEQQHEELFTGIAKLARLVRDSWRQPLPNQSSATVPSSFGTGMTLRFFQYATFQPTRNTQSMVQMVDEWLVDYERLPSEQRPYAHVYSIFGGIKGLGRFSVFDTTMLEALFERLAKHSDPLIRFYAMRGRLQLKWELQKTLADDRARDFRPLRQEVLAFLETTELQTQGLLRRACYEFLHESLTSIGLSESGTEFIEELEAICDALQLKRIVYVRMLEEWSRPSRKLDEATARRGLARMDAALELFASSSVAAVIDQSSHEQTRQQLLKARAEFLTHWPALQIDAGDSAAKITLLVEYPPSRMRDIYHYLSHPLVEGEFVYALLQPIKIDAGKHQRMLQLVRIPLAGGPPVMLGSVKLPLDFVSSVEAREAVAGTCLHRGRMYAATRAGVFEFELQEPSARSLPAVKSFPSAAIQSVMGFGDTLYAGLEGGYLVAFDPDEESCRVLVSSRRKEKQSPLDDRDAFQIPALLPDVPRNRLLLLARNRTPNGINELWEYRPESHGFQRILEFKSAPRDVRMLTKDRILVNFGFAVVAFDLANNRPFTVCDFPLGPQLPPDRVGSFKLVLYDPVWCAGRLWSPQSQGLNSQLRAVTIEQHSEAAISVAIPPLEKEEIFAGWYVAPVDERRFLWSNHHRLWLVTPASTTRDEPTSKPLE